MDSLTATAATDELVRRLIVCCDGTSNTLTGGLHDTNVLKLHGHLVARAHPHTFLYYDPGVGAVDAAPPTGLMDWLSRLGGRLAALASGRGIYENIEQAYLFLMRHWRPGDRILLFGFSRGAFTVRAVAGMVNLFGLLRPECEVMLPTLIRVYFSQPADRGGRWWQVLRRLNELTGDDHGDREALVKQIKDNFTTSASAHAAIHWVGVWDTVDSVGLPGPLKRDIPAAATLRGKRIRHVRQALALDEFRVAYLPRVYEEPEDIWEPDVPGGQTFRQRWFDGSHSDVGGGYPQTEAGLSDRSLRWMLAELAEVEDGAWLGPLPGPSDAQLIRHDPLWEAPWWALAGIAARAERPDCPMDARST